MKITVITAIYGGYDDVPPKPIGFDRYILVSDVPITSDWENIVFPSSLSPRLASKIPKFRPDLFTDSEYSVWMDGSFRDPTGWLSAETYLQLLDHDLILFRHPQRETIEEELIASREVVKYDNEPLERQVAHYKDNGFPDNIGLWAGGLIARRHSETNKILGTRWFFENAAWSIQDQISLPFVLWELGISPNAFSCDQYSGPIKWIRHAKEEQPLLAGVSKLPPVKVMFKHGVNLLVRLKIRTLFVLTLKTIVLALQRSNDERKQK